jgi:hypothetical protein
MKEWEDKTFNMDMLFLERINMRLDELDKATIAGDQFIRYRVLNTVYMDTYFKYEDKCEKLNSDFSVVKNILNLHAPSRASMAQHQAIIVSQAEEALDLLHFAIIKLLYENDLIYLKKKIKLSAEEEVEADY